MDTNEHTLELEVEEREFIGCLPRHFVLTLWLFNDVF